LVVHVVSVVPLNLMVTVDPEANPLPLTEMVTDEVWLPDVGLRAIDATTVKVADAGPPVAGVAVTVYAPAWVFPDGTVIVQEKVPVLLVVQGFGLGVTEFPLKVNVTVVDAAKYVPLMVMVVLDGPEAGLSVIRETVNWELPALPLASVATTVAGPGLAVDGTVKEQLPVMTPYPFTTLLHVPADAPAKVKEREAVWPAKPLPVTVALVPVPPLVGERVTDGTTVRLDEAE
jgi:hypothetical protein